MQPTFTQENIETNQSVIFVQTDYGTQKLSLSSNHNAKELKLKQEKS
jgi:hypothetical protein